MTGVSSGGASEQALSSSVNAAAEATVTSTLFILLALCTCGHRVTHRRSAGETHLGTVTDSIGRIFDHAIVRRQAGGQLDRRSLIALHRYRLEQHAIVGIHGGHGQSLGIEDER